MATQFATASNDFDNAALPMKREWGTAFSALRRLLANGDDTQQVFTIMRALNGDVVQSNYRKLLSTPGGGPIAYRRIELAERLSDRAWIESFAPGTVGASYRAFIDSTGYTPDGLVEVSSSEFSTSEQEHPYTWMGRRERDIHDIWHVLTGYNAGEHLGEACLVAFSYAQTGGLGWGFIGLGAALKSLRITGKTEFFRAVAEGYRNGKRASWLHAEDYERLMEEPIDEARRRLRIADTPRYRTAQASLRAAGIQGI